MKCPVCDHFISCVLYTTRLEEGTYRRRKCEHCDFVFYTRETYVMEDLPKGFWDKPTIPGRRALGKRR